MDLTLAMDASLAHRHWFAGCWRKTAFTPAIQLGRLALDINGGVEKEVLDGSSYST
jgi:phosphoribosylanthranilate isomerase